MAKSAAERKAASRAKKALVAKMPPLLVALHKANTDLPELPVIEASNDGYHLIFDTVFCDWLSISHPLRVFHPVINDGRVSKIMPNGEIEWVTECWQTIESDSSDTTLRIKCDGQKLMLTGNIGRFGQTNNLTGYSVFDCCLLWQDLLDRYYPSLGKLFQPDFEMVNRLTGQIELSGTRITRCDLTSNFDTDNFSRLSSMLMGQPIGQLPPRMGKYGVMWGYEAKRSQWFRAKIYDKTCELEGRRTPAHGATTARFEIQLGSEFLRRNNLHIVSGWLNSVMKKDGVIMKKENIENVIYGQFSDQVFKNQASVESWSDIPVRLRHYAIMWRDGHSLRSLCGSKATYYRVLKQLQLFGVDCSQPCNVMNLVRRVEVVKIMPLNSLRSQVEFLQHRRDLSALLNTGLYHAHEVALLENQIFDNVCQIKAA